MFPPFQFLIDVQKGWIAGYTIVEMMIVLAILATLLGLAVPAYKDHIDDASIARASEEIRTIETELREYVVRMDALPDSLDDINRGSLRDPWGNLYCYFNITTQKGNGQARKDRFLVPLNSDFDLYSMGKDGKSMGPLTAKMSRDDIIRANDGGYVGLASEY